jgi:pimeloyl-ACP methyl ester carboxylesterase
MNSHALLRLLRLLLIAGFLVSASAAQDHQPIGKMVNLGGHRLHVHCTGRGSPIVVIENGFDEFSFDWVLVQARVEKFTRVCTYDRAGYAWSDPGPKPRTYAQINIELRDALKRIGERPPYVLVGHSFGGPVVRNFALIYPKEVSGMVLVDTVGAGQRVPIGNKAIRLDSMAQGRSIPSPREQLAISDNVTASPPESGDPPKIESPYDKLPTSIQKLHQWAQVQSALQDAEGSEREWSPEYLARWNQGKQEGSLGNIPVIVLARENGGYGDDLDIPGARLETERKAEQAKLAMLSSDGKLVMINSGHDMQLDVPDRVAVAIRSVVEKNRSSKKRR